MTVLENLLGDDGKTERFIINLNIVYGKIYIKCAYKDNLFIVLVRNL